LPEGITVDLAPDPAGVDSLARQIRQTGRAYPLFDIAFLILKRADRYQLEFKAQGNLPDGSPRQFYVCNLDDTLWLSEGDAVRHILARHFATFYQTEKIAVDPPKGTYTFVAQCGMSGVVLGPPNLHDYQAKLQRLHSERFARMPFDVFKSRVRIVRDEAVNPRGNAAAGFRQEFVCLNLAEPLKLESREAVERHFREVHLPNIVHTETSHIVRTPAAREALPPILGRLARREFDLQQRFPLKLVTRLSDDFAHRGLHFFKVNKNVLHIAVARPRYLDLEATPVSDGVKRIVDTINATPDCTRRKLLETLGFPLPPADAPPAAPGTPETPPSPELAAMVSDLHWLVHEGHVIEFANGRMETAKKPAPRPVPIPRPPRPAAAAAADTPTSAVVPPAPTEGSGAPGATTGAEAGAAVTSATATETGGEGEADEVADAGTEAGATAATEPPVAEAPSETPPPAVTAEPAPDAPAAAAADEPRPDDPARLGAANPS